MIQFVRYQRTIGVRVGKVGVVVCLPKVQPVERSEMIEGMPQLISGAGQTPADGGCVMQVADYLWSGGWTDAPVCVHPVLRNVAINVNDSVSEEERQKLYLLIPRLMETAINDPVENKRVSVALAVWSAEKVFHLVPEQDKKVCHNAITAAKAWLTDGSTAGLRYAANAAAYAAYAAKAAANAAAYAAYAAKITFLIELLDEYDRITDRKTIHEVTDADWQSVCSVVETQKALVGA